jgi:hypothetical protein
MSGGQVRLTGRLRVALPPREAFRLFTPRGERDWAEGWEPRFPVPAPDDTVPGTVFETGAHGATTTWLVLAREPGRHISYARVTPGDRAGTVAVTLDEAGGQSSVEVTYGRCHRGLVGAHGIGRTLSSGASTGRPGPNVSAARESGSPASASTL